ncbi:MAG: DUF456 domain-containing protein [Rubripirellula sp.]
MKIDVIQSGASEAGLLGPDWTLGLPLATSVAGGWFGWVEPTGTVLAAATLILLCIVAWAGNLITLPGNWIAVALMAGYALLGPTEGRAAIGYAPVIAAFACAMIGEIFEFIAAAFGAQKAGASRKSTIFAVIGSMCGALLGAIIGLPIPIVGPVLAAILFGGIGATAGAMFGEWTDGRSWRESWPIGHAAFWGRTFGTLGKVTAGMMIIVIAIASVVF